LAVVAKDVGIALTQVLGLGFQEAAAEASLLIGYSIGKGAQALIIIPLLEERQPHASEVTYAGPDHPLIKLGMSHVWKAIDYPVWFTFPTIPSRDRQQLVDLFTQRELLRSVDESVSNIKASTPVTYNKVLDLLQTLLDAAGSTVGSPINKLSVQQVNRILEANGVLPLIGPREGYEMDQPSQRETDGPKASGYAGPNGDDIRSIDLQLVLLRRKYDVPPDVFGAPNK
jgi:hypothetical protein